jgi:Galactose oxidase, central domain
MRFLLLVSALASVAVLAEPRTARALDHPIWSQQPPLSTYGNAAALDRARNRWLFIRPSGDTRGPADVWAFNLTDQRWRHIETLGVPPETGFGATALYDPVHDRLVLIGNSDSPTVWTLTLSGTPEWNQVAGLYLNGYWGVSYVYDSRRDRILAFGGASGHMYESYTNAVYAIQLEPPQGPTLVEVLDDPVPLGRDYSAAAYDSLRDRLVVYGGRSHPPHDDLTLITVDETWALSLSANPPTWRFLPPSSAPAPGRERMAYAHDPDHDRLWIQGGTSFSSGEVADAWSLDLSDTNAAAWRGESILPSKPRQLSVGAYDRDRNRFLVGGGTGGGSTFDYQDFNEVWSLPSTSGAWSNLVPNSITPRPHYNNVPAVYDPNGERFLLVGTGATSQTTNEVWMLKNESWQRLAGDVDRSSFAVAMDPVRNRLMMFGGMKTGPTTELLALDLASPTPTWSLLTTSGASPQARSGHSMIYDPVGDQMVVFGGFVGPGNKNANDVWTLSLSGTPTWTALSPSGAPPASRRNHLAVYDALRRRMIIAAGIDTNGTRSDVWALSLDSPAWNRINVTGPPPAFQAAEYDRLSDRLVAIGGQSYVGGHYAVQAWGLPLASPTAWSLLTPTGNGPDEIDYPASAYDTKRDALMLFGIENVTPGDRLGCWGLFFDATTDVLASLLSVDATPERVHLVWFAPNALASTSVERRRDGSEWTAIGLATHETPETIVYEDHAVVPGKRYEYRVMLDGPEGPQPMGFATATVPLPPPPPLGTRISILELLGASPNPSPRGLNVRFSVPWTGNVELDVFDVTGRRRASRRDVFDAGWHLVAMDPDGEFAAGAYLIRLRFANVELNERCVIIR